MLLAFIPIANAETALLAQSHNRDIGFGSTVFKGTSQPTLELALSTYDSTVRELYIQGSADKYTIDPGEIVTFSASVENYGNQDITQLDIADMDTQNIVYSNAVNIPAGALEVVDFQFTTYQTVEMYFKATATFSDGHTDTNVFTTSTTVTPNIRVELTSDKDTVPVGDIIKFNVQVGNYTNQPIKSIQLKMYSQPDYDYATNISIAPGATGNIEISLTINQIIDVEFNVTATFDDNTTASADTNLIPINVSGSTGRSVTPRDNSDEEWARPNEDDSTQQASSNEQGHSAEQENGQSVQANGANAIIDQNENPDQKDKTLMTVVYTLLGLCGVGAVTLIAILVRKMSSR
jgi:uncharacterized repeat protein (TIGR01451 family)